MTESISSLLMIEGFMPKVSVIMPVFNGERYLSESITSILDQSFEDFEFIIINDGSTDKSSRILRSFKDERIRLIEREHQGFSLSLNEAIQLSKGNYIARMDADDIAMKDRLRLQYDFLESHSELDILGGQAEVMDKTGKTICKTQNPLSWKNISKHIKYACPLCHPTYFVRKEVYDLTRGYRVLPPADDYDFLLRAFDMGCVMRNLPDIVIKKRESEGGMSFRNFQKTICFAAAAQKMHRLRVHRKQGEAEIFFRLQSYQKKPSSWFKFVYNVRSRLLKTVRKNSRTAKVILGGYIIFVPLLHHQLAIYSYNSLRALQWKK